MEPTPLPFEFPFRWNALREFFDTRDEATDYLDERDRKLEDFLAASVVPLVFHWNGQVDRFVNVRNGPGEFRMNGTVYMIRYRWDTAPAANVTVEWQLDGVTAFTHTLTGGDAVHVEMPATAYAQEALVAIVTSVGADALGLSAFVYFQAR